jgi:DNA-binding transcriptional regulator YhcF (GntR family)
MARTRSAHVTKVKAALVARLDNGLAQPGGRFLSTRAVAQRFGISYQTAHVLLAELAEEGLLNRKAASGSFIPGRQQKIRGAELVFSARAKRKDSFGARLLQSLEAALAARAIAVTRTWIDEAPPRRLRADHYPVIWECRAAMQLAATERRFALCLNDTPPAGLSGGFIDAITTDDFSGGACAAELLKTRTGRTSGFAILGGPKSDVRSRQRIAGFCDHTRNARVVFADSWFLEAGRDHAEEILAFEPAGIFACNDRLAEAVVACAREQKRTLPPLVGFDNAPIAERLGLTTIGIPWETMVTDAVELIASRLTGDTSPSKLLTLSHEPIIRMTA